ncbi:MAG TPA: glycosyltransferase [Gemmatimonadales bacterium]|nr:glycosyltransferase [Gemmatimonadales bacterium]
MTSRPGLPLTFIIPVLNGERFMERCLEYIRRESAPGDEIIVVDNGSRDRTVALVRAAPGVTLLEAPGVTIAGLRNLGARAARNGTLAFIDADCLVCPGWRASVERVLSDPAVTATGSYYDVPEQSTWVERAWWSFRPRHEHRATFIISGNLIVRKAAFDAVGGFDATLVTDEDTDLSRRLVAAGAVLVEAPSVRVIHLGNAKTLRHFYRKEKWHATSILATMRSHTIDRPMMLTFLFLLSIGMAAAAPFVLHGPFVPVVMLLCLLTAPGITALYKVYTHGNYRYFFQLLPLYFVVYLVRSLILIEAALKPRAAAAQ